MRPRRLGRPLIREIVRDIELTPGEFHRMLTEIRGTARKMQEAIREISEWQRTP